MTEEEKRRLNAEIEAARRAMAQSIEEYSIEMLEIVRDLEKEISDWKEKYQRKVSELEQVTRERDAAVGDLAIACYDNSCEVCAHYKFDDYYITKRCDDEEGL